MFNCQCRKNIKQNNSISRDSKNRKIVRKRSKLYRKLRKQKNQTCKLTNKNSIIKFKIGHFLYDSQSKSPKFLKGVFLKKENTQAANQKLFNNIINKLNQQFCIDCIKVNQQEKRNSKKVTMSINKERYSNINKIQSQQKYFYRIKSATKYFNRALRKGLYMRYKEFFINFFHKQRKYAEFYKILIKRQTMLTKTAFKLMSSITNSYSTIIHKIYQLSNKTQKPYQGQFKSNLLFLIESNGPLLCDEQILFGEQKNRFYSFDYEILSIHLKKPKKTK